MTPWNILYRGTLSSCNYACTYCPFAKTTNTPAELAADSRDLLRFVEWVEAQSPRPIAILMTPWGEALIHRSYREALVRLSHLPHVHRVAIQTNLSAPLEELAQAHRETLGLWSTFHPSQVSVERFLNQCHRLEDLGIRYSVGVVGLREHLEAIDHLRATLPAHRYVWINAYKRDPQYYDEAVLHRLRAVDPYFDWNNRVYPSVGKPCRAGHTSFTVDGSGIARRCHFIPEEIGNIYTPDFPSRLEPRPCTNATCQCYIGYVHRPDLEMDVLFGEGLLDRIPHGWPERNPQFGVGP